MGALSRSDREELTVALNDWYYEDRPDEEAEDLAWLNRVVCEAVERIVARVQREAEAQAVAECRRKNVVIRPMTDEEHAADDWWYDNPDGYQCHCGGHRDHPNSLECGP